MYDHADIPAQFSLAQFTAGFTFWISEHVSATSSLATLVGRFYKNVFSKGLASYTECFFKMDQSLVRNKCFSEILYLLLYLSALTVGCTMAMAFFFN